MSTPVLLILKMSDWSALLKQVLIGIMCCDLVGPTTIFQDDNASNIFWQWCSSFIHYGTCGYLQENQKEQNGISSDSALMESI